VTGGEQLATTQLRVAACDRGRGTQTAPDPELALALAIEARRTGLLMALARMGAILTIDRLDELLIGKYGEELAEVTVGQLTERVPRSPLLPRPDESIEDAVMRVFEGLRGKRLSSGFFVRHMGLQRWTAQSLLAELAEQHRLEREGRTSGTRYWLDSS
jgi:hypothetical protein